MISILLQVICLKYQRSIALVMLASVLVYLLSLAVPLSFMAVIDRVLSSNGYASLLVIFGLLIVVAGCECMVGFVSGRLAIWLSCCHGAEISALFFDKLFSLDLSENKALSSGEALSRLGEIDSLAGQINEWISQFSLDLIFMVIFTIVAFGLSPELTLLVIACTPLHLLQYFMFNRSIKRKSEQQFEASIAYHNLFVEGVQSLRYMQASGSQEKIKSDLYSSYDIQSNASFALSNTSLKSEQLSQVIAKICDASILFIGASLVLDQSMSLGALVAFNMIKDRVTNPLLRIASIWEECLNFNIALKRVAKLMDASSEVPSGELASLSAKSAIELNLVKLLHGSTLILDNFSWEIELGKNYAITGASGTGKSTLLNLIHGQNRNYQGSVKVDGKDLKQLSIHSWREQISYVHQSSGLFNRTIAENVLYACPNPSIELLEQVCEMACILDVIQDLAQGFQTSIDTQHAQLSGGQIQRIIIARALAEQKPMLLLDEATSALDKETESRVLSNILNSEHLHTTILVSHRQECCEIADVVVELKASPTAHKNCSSDTVLNRTVGVA